MKPKRSFYNLSYAEAMFTAKEVDRLSGGDGLGPVYRQWMTAYDRVWSRRKQKELVFHEALPNQATLF